MKTDILPRKYRAPGIANWSDLPEHIRAFARLSSTRKAQLVAEAWAEEEAEFKAAQLSLFPSSDVPS